VSEAADALGDEPELHGTAAAVTPAPTARAISDLRLRLGGEAGEAELGIAGVAFTEEY
jgi:hypothetical protein